MYAVSSSHVAGNRVDEHGHTRSIRCPRVERNVPVYIRGFVRALEARETMQTVIAIYYSSKQVGGGGGGERDREREREREREKG